MNENPFITCDKCKKYGFEFRSTHNISPVDFIDGNVNADIWIIGLNPKNKIGFIEERQLTDFQNFDPDCHQYFRDFKKVSEKIYRDWKSQNSNIAHTDLVKCFSETFPPKSEENKEVNQDQIVENCIGHLKTQILKGKPKLIICNGSPVCWEMIKIFQPQQTTNLDCITSYSANIGDHKFWIVLSGFIGRIDNRNKRRLGLEIEKIIDNECIELKPNA